MKKLNYELKELCRANRDGSYNTQSDRFKSLQLMATQLESLGYRQMSVHSMKPRHVTALVNYWRSQQLSIGTLKNRLSHLRWWARKIDKHNVVAKSNEAYGIEPRQLVGFTSKARTLSNDQLDKVSNPYFKMSLRLQQAFGLRREEAIKCIPYQADQGDKLRLKASWCKGGKARDVPLLTGYQREILDQAKQLVGQGSLIPPQLNYRQQLYRYEKQTARAGLHKLHGLRHHYAQMRYEALTGWPCPACGGPGRSQLTSEQIQQDKIVRAILSRELGHERPQILAIYCN